MPLIVKNVSKSFGGLTALNNVTLTFTERRVTAVVGANGAGKSTLFNIIGGYIQPDRGHVYLSGLLAGNGSVTQITGMLPHRVAAMGIGMLFQSVRVFERLTAVENVLTGFSDQVGERLLSALIKASSVRREEQRNLDEAMSLLRFVGLEGKESQPAGTLSFGEQKLLAIARLLAAKAKVLLLDEPTSGVHPAMVEQLLSLVQHLAHKDSRIVALIEHNERVVRQVADTVFTLEQGGLVTDAQAGLSVQEYGEPKAGLA
jgi:ABC-type branched-subunit amino acid transport system ATPase component